MPTPQLGASGTTSSTTSTRAVLDDQSGAAGGSAYQEYPDYLTSSTATSLALTADTSGNVYFGDSLGLEAMNMNGSITTLSSTIGTVDYVQYSSTTKFLYAHTSGNGADALVELSTSGAVQATLPIPPSISLSPGTALAIDGSTNTAYFLPLDASTGAYDLVGVADFGAGTITTVPASLPANIVAAPNQIAFSGGTLYYLAANAFQLYLELFDAKTMKWKKQVAFPSGNYTPTDLATSLAITPNGSGAVVLPSAGGGGTAANNVYYVNPNGAFTPWYIAATQGWTQTNELPPGSYLVAGSAKDTATVASPNGTYIVTSAGQLQHYFASSDPSPGVGLINKDGNVWTWSGATFLISDVNSLFVSGPSDPLTLAFSNGTDPSVTLEVGEDGYLPTCNGACANGPFSVTSAVKGVVTITYVGPTQQSNIFDYQVTAKGVGSTTIVVSDKMKNTYELPVTVTGL